MCCCVCVCVFVPSCSSIKFKPEATNIDGGLSLKWLPRVIKVPRGSPRSGKVPEG